MGFDSEGFEDTLLSLKIPSGWKFGLICRNPLAKSEEKKTQNRKYEESSEKLPELCGFWAEDDQKLADEPYEHSRLYLHLGSV